MAKARVTPEEFLEVYQMCDSAEEVAKKLGMNVASVKSKVYYYRSIGVKNIKTFPRQKKLIDVKSLSEFAGSLLPKSGKKNKKSKAAA